MNRIFLGILISIATQTHKPFYDLTMETRGVPEGVAALTRSRKSTPGVSLRKQRPSLPQAFRMVWWKLCLQFPLRTWDTSSHRPSCWSVTLGTCYWNGTLPAQLKQWRLRQKGPLWTGTPQQTLLRAGTVGQRECCLSLCVSDSQLIGLAAR